MTDESYAERELIRAARDAGRTIIVDGASWSVYELPPPQFDRRRGPSLVFECHEMVRVVRRFPTTWRQLSNDALFALSWAV